MSSNYGKPQPAVSGEIPVCLCKQVKNNHPTRPKLVYSKRLNVFLMYCPSCGFETYPDWCKNAVIAEWCGANKSGDLHIQNLWMKKFEEQQNKDIAARLHTAGTTVPA